MQKKTWLRVLACFLILVLITVGCAGLNSLTRRKYPLEKNADFFSQEQDFDVLFFGNSHMINAVYPMELWREYGIVSYNMATHDILLPTTYWVMRQAMQIHQPKLAVIDVYNVWPTKKTNDFSFVVEAMDAFPLTGIKAEAAYDLTDDPVVEEWAEAGLVHDVSARRPESILFNYSLYHSRWNELTRDDFIPVKSAEKGAEARLHWSAPAPFTLISPNDLAPTDNVMFDYLRRIIEECQSHGVEVLLISAPFPASEGNQQRTNSARELAAEYDVPLIDFLRMDVVDLTTDCYDEDSHLNPSGARKVTSWLGEYLMANYDLTDHRNDETYGFWHEDYEAYMQALLDQVAGQEDLATVLTACAGWTRYSVTLKTGNARLMETEPFRSLLQRDDAPVLIETDTESVIVTLTDNKTGEVVYRRAFEYMQDSWVYHQP